MSKLPVVSGPDLVRALTKTGFQFIRQKGSHMVLQKRDFKGTITTVIPNHRELAAGTLRSILRKIDMQPEELVRLLTALLGTGFLFR